MHLTGGIDERLLEEVLLDEQPGPSTQIDPIDEEDEDDGGLDQTAHAPGAVSQDALDDATASFGAAFASVGPVSGLFSSSGMDPRLSLTQMHHAQALAAAAAAAAAANVVAATAAASRSNVAAVLPQQIAFSTSQSPLFPLDVLQTASLHPAAGFLVPHTAYLLPSTQQLACPCMYNNGSQPCAVHHGPIAYGQASSAFPVGSASTSQIPHPTSGVSAQPAVQQVTRPVAQNPPPPTLPPPASSISQHNFANTNQSIPTIQNTPISSVLSLPPVPIQSSLPPTLPHQMRSMALRLKRSAPHPHPHPHPHPNTHQKVSAKVRRVEGRPSGDAELSPEPPSTSQLQRSPSLALGQLQLCTNCQEGARAACIGCVPCHHCVYCQHHQPTASAAPPPAIPPRPSVSIAQPNPIGSASLLHCSHPSSTSAAQPAPSPVGVQQVQRDNSLQQAHNVASGTATSLQEQHYLRYRTLNEAIWARQLSAFDPATNNAASQAQIVTPFTLRQLSALGNQPLFVVPRSGFPAAIQNATRLDFVLAALPTEAFDVRPLERQHATAVFGGQPVAEPQPVGASLADIEKFSQRSEFVKEVEVPENEKERCTVCLMEFETGEGVRTLRCTHLFHVDCIDKWLVYNKKCPVCRVEVDCPAKALLVQCSPLQIPPN